METYGFTNRPTHTRLVLQLHPRVAKELDFTLLNLTQPLSRVQRNSYALGTLQIRPKRQLGYVSFKCAPQLRSLASVAADHICTSNVTFPAPIMARHFYVCPKGHQKLADFPFDLHHASKPIWCSLCTKPYVGAQWNCACNKSWFTCPLHPPQTNKTKPRVCGKRPAPKAFDAQGADAKLRRLEPIVNRPIIGPRLQAKFPHLASSFDAHKQAEPDFASASLSISHRHNADDGLRCIAVVDPADNNAAQETEPLQTSNSSSSGSNFLGSPVRKDDNNISAAALAGAELPLLAAAGKAASAPAAAVIQKKRSKPFRIPKRT